jgi:lantibiotic modifying enzyme
MTDLFDPDRHEALANIAWDAGAASAAIERIVADARGAFTAHSLWPIHPADGPPEWSAQSNLYFGAAGVVWALDYLQREGAAAEGPSFAEHLSDIEARNAGLSAAFGAMTSGYLLAQSGVLAVRWRLTRDPAHLDELAALIAQNTHSAAREIMWGAPGTMLIAVLLYEETGEARWADLFRAGAVGLKAEMALEPDLGVKVWTQDLFGARTRFVGAVHGFAGNAAVLIKGRDLLEPAVRHSLEADIVRTLSVLARRHGALANWPAKLVFADDPPSPMLVQHCHGAPGMVTCLAGLDEPIDELLIAGGELTWRAGPLRKGANLCHGTAGNGYAFLKLLERTGDEMWLARARAFAMHAIVQWETRTAELGRGHYSLGTGDLGLACYLSDCIQEQAWFPTLDIL